MFDVHDVAWRNYVVGLERVLDADPGLVDDENEYGSSPLLLASASHAVEAARILLDRGASVNKANRGGGTPLIAACEGGHFDVASLLLERGADPALRDHGGCTCLMRASKDHPGVRDCVPLIRLLVEDGRVPLDAQDKSGRTALHYACRDGKTEAVEVLCFEAGVDPTIRDHQGLTPKGAAAQRGDSGCIKLIRVRAGAG